VGFQLSYIALFFITHLLASIWNPRNKPLKYIWGILTVSFAATNYDAFEYLLFSSVSRFIFHHEPRSHPLLSFIMTLGILVMVLASFNYVPLFLSKPLEWSIYYLNKIINSIASFENFIIRDIPLNTYLLLSSYLLIVASIIWFKKPSFNKLIIVLLAIIATSYVYPYPVDH
jgi:competence protein ComEC